MIPVFGQPGRPDGGAPRTRSVLGAGRPRSGAARLDGAGRSRPGAGDVDAASGAASQDGNAAGAAGDQSHAVDAARVRAARGVSWRAERGQATVELVALAPVVVAAAMALMALLAAGRANEIAGSAAQAGAMALLRGADATAAARRVVPPSHRPGLEVLVRGRAVTVRVRPRVPVLATRLTASSTADAGARP